MRRCSAADRPPARPPSSRPGLPSGIIAAFVPPARVGRRLHRRFLMRQMVPLLAALTISTAALAAAPRADPAKAPPTAGPAPASVFTPRTIRSTGTVSVEGRKIAYDAMAGTIIVHPKGWDDAAKPQGAKDEIGTKDGPPIASIFYVAYFKQGVDPRTRPVTFLYNGGPGSSTIWLHMGAFGPVRVVTSNDSHT